ncbi:MAG: NADH-quinone oxidoreductase subunit M, partial [Actinobacteria bacterium]|nr:NADH-quinone oxidoreductase subunit M [Actinomycetota bacterium]
MPKANEPMVKMVALLTSIATLAVGIFTLTKFDFDKAGSMQFVAEHEWIPLIKSSYLIGLDGISLPLYILSMVITLLVVIYSLNHVPDPGNPKAFFILMLVLQTGMAG